MYVPTVKVGTAMAKSRRDVAFEQSERIALEREIRKREEGRTRRRRYTPMTKAQFRYWVMRDLGLLVEYFEDFE